MLWGPEDWDALALRETDESWKAPEEDAIRARLRRIPDRRRLTVADLGCGRGRWLPFLSENFGHVVAVDYAPASLALARRGATAPNVAFRRRDLRDLTPFRNRFDVVLAVDSIVGPRLRDVDRVLAQVRSSLKQGGLLLATFPATRGGGGPRPMALGSTTPTPLEFHEVEIQYRLRGAGFRGVRVRRLSRAPDGAESVLCLASRRADN